MSTMTNKPASNAREQGVALVLVAGLLVVLLLFVGLSVDLGMAYLVKAQLIKATDGAALAAARALGDEGTSAEDEAVRIFKANFPDGYLGTSFVTDPASDPDFFNTYYDLDSGSNIITIQAQATIPVTFLRLAGLGQMTVVGEGEARRRLVDLSLVIDTSTSIGSDWSTVRDAARAFINSFDANNDRMAVTLFSNGAHVSYEMPSSRGFNKTAAKDAVPTYLPGGFTAMAEGLYRGWDELRTVPSGSQAGLRVIVAFTDGCTNTVPGYYTYNGHTLSQVTGYATTEFPWYYPIPWNMSSNSPLLGGLYLTDCEGGGWWGPTPPNCDRAFGTYIWHNVNPWDSTYVYYRLPWLPETSSHENYRSSGIPTSFPLQTSTLTVDGVPQSSTRGLRNFSSGKYPADVWNTNNAARNLLEIIANAARSEYPSAGDYPIRIYTIGMAELLRYNLGTRSEKAEDILKRIANDKTSADYNPAQATGKYYYAETAADVEIINGFILHPHAGSFDVFSRVEGLSILSA
jgi:Flp pilus assembly protein TadG